MTVLTAGMARPGAHNTRGRHRCPVHRHGCWHCGRPCHEVTVAHATHVPVVEHTVRTMFVTAPGPLAELIAIDPVIAGLEARYPGLRPVLQLDPLTALIRAISAQQVNLRWATTTRRRLAEAFGCQHTRLPPGLQPCCRTSRRCRCHGPTRLTIDHTQSGIHRCTGHCK